MNTHQINSYAELLTTYCCNIQPGDRVLIRSTYLAENLIQACHKSIIQKGGVCEYMIALPGMAKQWYSYASDDQLKSPPLLQDFAIKRFDVIITINAPYDIFELKDIEESKLALAQAALRPIKKRMMKRSSEEKLRWVLCNFPTESLATAANMSLEKYTTFLTNACFLHHSAPQNMWESLSSKQSKWVDVLNKGKTIHFKSKTTNIRFNIEKRRWINSDGKRNMPSGEIFTSPVETSADGEITFDIPTLISGKKLSSVQLMFKKGLVVDWKTPNNIKILDQLFKIKGANRVGEIAIGTNYEIKNYTLNTLFDEKIGGTIHLAIGASYPETGGKNTSSIHHDFVSSFSEDSEISLDDRLIYQNGKFVV